MKPQPAPLAPGHRRAVIVMLRFLAISSLMALAAVLSPHSWMHRIHLAIGLGDLPDIPMVSYLSRSLSLFYAWLGAMVLFVSFDVDRYRGFIRFFAVGGIFVAILQTGIDLAAPLPTWWWASESGFLFSYFGALVWLTRS